MPDGKDFQLESDAPADAQQHLLDALYADAGSLIVGSTITAAVAIFSWRLSGAWLPLGIAICVIVISTVRVSITAQRQRQKLDWLDFVYSGCSIVYVMCIGALAWWALLFTNDAFILTTVLIIYLTNVLSIALRSFAVKRVVSTHTLALVGPVLLAFVMKGGYFYFAALMQIMLASHVDKSAARLRSIFLSEITYRRRSDTVASRFRFAIDNMSHGMCMIDRNMRIVVSNAELTECFGVPESRSLQGVRFGALMRLAVQRGTMSRIDSERLMASFETTRDPDSVARLESPDGHGRVYDLTLKRHLEGGWVLVVQDVTDQRRAREALDKAARFDGMTALPNRRSFEEKLTEALLLAEGKEGRTEVLFLDLDGFKQINDTLGHKFGDRVLAESGLRLQEAAEGAYVSRWGGDEFVILRSGPDNEATLAFAQNLIRYLSRPIWIDGAEVVVGATVGASVGMGGSIGPDTLLQQADMALYAAKREARGTCRLYEFTMSEQAQERRLLELDLQAALAARSFELNYQPIVDIDTGVLISFEALARWRHPVRGPVSPDIFIRVLEELNLMNSFGAWTLQKACEDASKWPLPIRVGVNVSTRQIETLVDSVRQALNVSGLAPDRLELEITETAALASGDTVSKALETVRAMGVKIALDDFGTGYSSLSHLMRLPLDKVKIDKSFTQQLGKSRRADVLVANIARISSQLGMRVTFEGIETPEQLDRARALGVKAEGQGWLFGKPMAVEYLDALFLSESTRAVA